LLATDGDWGGGDRHGDEKHTSVSERPPLKNKIPGTSPGTDARMQSSVARATASGVTLSLFGCVRPGRTIIGFRSVAFSETPSDRNAL
jgi:hypothetical protein